MLTIHINKITIKFLLVISVFVSFQNIYAQKPEDRPVGWYMQHAADDQNRHYEMQRVREQMKERDKPVNYNNEPAKEKVSLLPPGYSTIPTEEKSDLTEEELQASTEALRAWGAAQGQKDYENNIRDPFMISAGDAFHLKMMYQDKMNLFFAKKDYKNAILCYDSLKKCLDYSTYKGNPEYEKLYLNDPDWNDAYIIASAYAADAYFAVGDFVNGLLEYQKGNFYHKPLSETKPQIYAGIYWNAYERDNAHKNYLDSVEMVCKKDIPAKCVNMYHTWSYAFMGRCEIEKGNYKSAEEILTMPIDYIESQTRKGYSDQLSFIPMNYYYYRAIARYREGSYRKAKKDCERSLEFKETIGEAEINALKNLIEQK